MRKSLFARRNKKFLELEQEKICVEWRRESSRDSCTTDVNLSRAFFYARQVWKGARVRRQRNPLEHHALHPPLFHYLRERNENPSDRDHRRRCASKLDDLVKSETPDAFLARDNKLN